MRGVGTASRACRSLHSPDEMDVLVSSRGSRSSWEKLAVVNGRKYVCCSTHRAGRPTWSMAAWEPDVCFSRWTHPQHLFSLACVLLHPRRHCSFRVSFRSGSWPPLAPLRNTPHRWKQRVTEDQFVSPAASGLPRFRPSAPADHLKTSHGFFDHTCHPLCSLSCRSCFYYSAVLLRNLTMMISWPWSP